MRIRSESAFCARPAAFGFFLLFTIVLTWPFAIRLDTATSDLGDPLLNTWILDWDLYSITNAPTHIYDANIFYPEQVPAGVQREPLRDRARFAAVLLLRLHAADGSQHRLPARLRLLRLRRVRSRPRADAIDRRRTRGRHPLLVRQLPHRPSRAHPVRLGRMDADDARRAASLLAPADDAQRGAARRFAC